MDVSSLDLVVLSGLVVLVPVTLVAFAIGVHVVLSARKGSGYWLPTPSGDVVRQVPYSSEHLDGLFDGSDLEDLFGELSQVSSVASAELQTQAMGLLAGIQDDGVEVMSLRQRLEAVPGEGRVAVVEFTFSDGSRLVLSGVSASVASSDMVAGGRVSEIGEAGDGVTIRFDSKFGPSMVRASGVREVFPA